VTTFAEMQSLVIGITKRPELVTMTDLAIRTATLRAHHTDFFPRDRASALFSYTLPTTSAFVDIANIFATAPQLRIPEWLQGEDPATQQPTEILDYLNSYKEFWDDDNVRKTSVFCQIGESFRVSFASATGSARLWYFKNPIVSAAGYSSWIADTYDMELAQWAAGIVWARTGLQEQANNAQAQVMAFKDMLVSSHMTSKV